MPYFSTAHAFVDCDAGGRREETRRSVDEKIEQKAYVGEIVKVMKRETAWSARRRFQLQARFTAQAARY
jgi:hypothetical protein